jgi:adenine-specific DNA-methyltransferase
MNLHVQPSLQKLRGGYYTPQPIADYITKWAIANKPEITLEPSCGDGVFLNSFIKLHKTGHLIVHELMADELKKAAVKAKNADFSNFTMHQGDFLNHAIKNIETGSPIYDAVIGNPPFIRYQSLEPDFQRKISIIFSKLNLKFTKHTNAWVPFILASLELLKPNGRLGMVIPSEIIHVMHAGPLRQYLAATCEKIMLIDPKELWFKDTQQGTVILMVIKERPHSEEQGGFDMSCQ